MIIKYFADDGTEFNNQWDCELYEKSENMKTGYPELFKVEFWDENDKKYYIDKDDTFADYIYNNACKVNIPSDDAFNGFHEWAKYCGWCEFEDDIHGPGMWKRYEKCYLNHEWICEETKNETLA